MYTFCFIFVVMWKVFLYSLHSEASHTHSRKSSKSIIIWSWIHHFNCLVVSFYSYCFLPQKRANIKQKIKVVRGKQWFRRLFQFLPLWFRLIRWIEVQLEQCQIQVSSTQHNYKKWNEFLISRLDLWLHGRKFWLLLQGHWTIACFCSFVLTRKRYYAIDLVWVWLTLRNFKTSRFHSNENTFVGMAKWLSLWLLQK